MLVGPGEGAGVIDVGDGLAVAMRIESHNHPSAVEPYQGAATGVGGIIRDIFSMGARPIALMDPLRFGPLDDAAHPVPVRRRRVGDQRLRQRRRRADRRRRGRVRRLLPRQPARQRAVPRPAARTSGSCWPAPRASATSPCCSGRRPGATASAAPACSRRPGSRRAREAKRPSVQVGDPFEEKRLIEACLALLDAGLAVGVQDLGAAGLSCAASETAAKAGAGMDVDVARVPRREPGMNAVEVMTSESQERMLAIVAARRPRRGARAVRRAGRSARRWSAGSPTPAGSASSTGVFDDPGTADGRRDR